MCSAASFQYPMPPMPLIGIREFLRDGGNQMQRDGLHRRTAIAAVRGFAADDRAAAKTFPDRRPSAN